MTPLYMIELRPDFAALLRYINEQGIETADGDDLGYGIHAWLSAAFGKLAPKPWRLLMDRRRIPRILGYCRYNADQLKQRFREFADPSVYAVCPEPDVTIADKTMPSWNTGRRLGFELQCCPVGRKARTGIEKDLFLIHADRSKEKPLRREAIYGEWVEKWLQRNQAATVNNLQLSGFQLVRLTRKSQGPTSRRKQSRIIRPRALLKGELTVDNPSSFSDLLARGIGRHRSFGYGMLLLRPPS